jgi:hypothetical protein
VYPGARSSIRFERLRDGIQDYEKIRILREIAADGRNSKLKASVASLNTFLRSLSYGAFASRPVAGIVSRARDLICSASRAASSRK